MSHLQRLFIPALCDAFFARGGIGYANFVMLIEGQREGEREREQKWINGVIFVKTIL